MSFEPYSMREIADRIQNLVHEAEKSGADVNMEPERRSLDDLLTDPAGAAKIGKEIDKNMLASKLKLDSQQSSELASAIDNLSKESPVINQENAIAVLLAFKMLAPKAGINENSLNEKYNKSFDDPVSYRHVEAALKDASEVSPIAKEFALKLAITLTKGSKGRRLDEGLEGILNAVLYAMNIAKSGNKSELLHMLDDFEIKYEGDNYAFDQTLWNDLIKNIKGLFREVLSKNQNSSPSD